VDPQQGAGNPITAAYPLPRKIEEEKNAAATPPKEPRRHAARRTPPPAPPEGGVPNHTTRAANQISVVQELRGSHSRPGSALEREAINSTCACCRAQSTEYAR